MSEHTADINHQIDDKRIARHMADVGNEVFDRVTAENAALSSLKEDLGSNQVPYAFDGESLAAATLATQRQALDSGDLRYLDDQLEPHHAHAYDHVMAYIVNDPTLSPEMAHHYRKMNILHVVGHEATQISDMPLVSRMQRDTLMDAAMEDARLDYESKLEDLKDIVEHEEGKA